MKIPFKVGDHIYSTKSGFYVGQVIEVGIYGKTNRTIKTGKYYLIIKDPKEGQFSWNQKEIEEHGFFK